MRLRLLRLQITYQPFNSLFIPIQLLILFLYVNQLLFQQFLISAWLLDIGLQIKEITFEITVWSFENVFLGLDGWERMLNFLEFLFDGG